MFNSAFIFDINSLVTGNRPFAEKIIQTRPARRARPAIPFATGGTATINHQPQLKQQQQQHQQLENRTDRIDRIDRLLSQRHKIKTKIDSLKKEIDIKDYPSARAKLLRILGSCLRFGQFPYLTVMMYNRMVKFIIPGSPCDLLLPCDELPMVAWDGCDRAAIERWKRSSRDASWMFSSCCRSCTALHAGSTNAFFLPWVSLKPVRKMHAQISSSNSIALKHFKKFSD